MILVFWFFLLVSVFGNVLIMIGILYFFVCVCIFDISKEVDMFVE